MDNFLRIATPSKSSSVSSSPHKDSKAKQRMKSTSKSRKTIFESSSEDEHTFSSYSGYSRSTARSPYDRQTHHYESNGEATSSSDMEVAQMADFKPLIPKNKKKQNPPPRRPNAHRNQLNVPHGSRNRGSSPSGSSSFRNRVNDQFDRTGGKINDFRSEIESLKERNRGNLSASNNERSTDTLMSQIQHEHEEQEEVLDDMQTVLERLNIMSQDIGNEIAEQDSLIKETQDEADYARDKMKRVEKQMNELMRKGGLTPCKVIMILGGIAVILVIIILSS